jgi:predicted membrane-bound spermidine synthase
MLTYTQQESSLLSPAPFLCYKSHLVNLTWGSAKTLAEGEIRPRPFLWLVTAALTGAIVMSLELAAFRLYAPYFGYSIYVWGTMVSVVMTALAFGYAMGGWLADRSRSGTILYLVIVGSGIYQLAALFAERPILRWLWQSGEFFGTTIASLIIFVPTMTALAVTAPFVIRLLARAEHIGITAGKVYALSTSGSIAGILITAFYLIPRLGTRMTLQILCASTLIVGASGLFDRSAAAAAIVVAAMGALLLPKLTYSPAVLSTTESAYNWVAVMHQDDLRWLVLNHPAYSQTTRKVGAVWSGSYSDDFALGPTIVPARRMLALGLGAGGAIISTLAVAPQLRVDAVEIDPKVAEVAAKYFGLPIGQGNLSVHIADARPWLASSRQSFDLIQVDIYQGGPYIPFYLISQEFFEEVSSHTNRDGLLMMNVYDTSGPRELLMATAATLRLVFPSVFVISRADGNHVVLAFPRQISVADIRQRLSLVDGETGLRAIAAQASENVRELIPPAGSTVFTDDRAPVEEITRRMLHPPR